MRCVSSSVNKSRTPPSSDADKDADADDDDEYAADDEDDADIDEENDELLMFDVTETRLIKSVKMYVGEARGLRLC